MLNEPVWLTIEDVVEYNMLVVEATGEPHRVRDRGLIESAVDSCRNHHAYSTTDDIVDLACTLMLGIARNHGFAQGNKRTGFVAAQAFLEINGYFLNLPDRTWLAELLIAAITDPAFEPAMRVCLRAHVEASDDASLRA